MNYELNFELVHVESELSQHCLNWNLKRVGWTEEKQHKDWPLISCQVL